MKNYHVTVRATVEVEYYFTDIFAATSQIAAYEAEKAACSNHNNVSNITKKFKVIKAAATSIYDTGEKD